MLALLSACSTTPEKEKKMVLIDPAHFHASLLQKAEIPGVGDTVLVFAPEGPDLESYINTVESFNSSKDNPTHWVINAYSESDWLEAIPEASDGDFVVLAGNNKVKTEYMLKAVEKGYNVLSDKPMAIDSTSYELLKRAYEEAEKKGLVIYDMMTERYDMLSVITRALVADKDLTGEDGNDTIDVLDVHHFCKLVNGSPTTRPWWYYDVRQQGEGIADVSSHYIDLLWWQCFPDKAITDADVNLTSAKHYPTIITPEQYKTSTGLAEFPEELAGNIDADGNLPVYSNGVIEYSTFGRNIRFEIRWDFQAEEGGGDSYHCVIPFENAVIDVRQDAETSWTREIFVKTDSLRAANAEKKLAKEFDFVKFEPAGEDRWRIVIPSEYRPTHEEHLNLVGRAFLSCICGEPIPAWEKVNTLTKYRLTTEAVRLANQ